MCAQAILQALGSAPFKKAYLLQGDQDAGKSSFLELVLRVFGNNTHSHVSIQRLTDDRFALAELENKMFNVHDDLSDVPMKDAGVFKEITGSSRHGIQRKGETGYDADLFAVHLYTCNTPPEVNERAQRDTAFWGRWEYLVFSNHFDSDPYFYNRVFTPANMSIFFHDVMKQVLEVHNEGLLANSDAGDIREKWNYNADPLYRYSTLNLIDSERNMYIAKDKFLTSYKRWCTGNDIEQSKILGDVNPFTRALDKYRIATKRIRDENGIRIPVYEIPMIWMPESSFAVTPIIQKTDQSSFS
jgi:phage/plasmid-associated DNA primase